MLEGAIRHQQAGRLTEAVLACQEILRIDNQHAGSLHLAGFIACQSGHYRVAQELLRKAVGLRDNSSRFHYDLGNALYGDGKFNEAAVSYNRALALTPEYADARSNLGLTLLAQGKPEEAMRQFERVLAIDPNHPEAHNNLGTLLKESGRFEEALEHYGQAIAFLPDYAEAHYNRAEIKTFHRGDDELAGLEALAAKRDLPAGKALYVHFALAKAFDDAGDYDQAFAHLSKGNALKRRFTHYDERTVRKRMTRMATVFERPLVDRLEGYGEPSPVPIFVLGMPRSGSTLIEQILVSHPQIQGVGELAAFETAVSRVIGAGGRTPRYPECLRSLDRATLRRIGQTYLQILPPLAAGKTRIVDKLPGNFLNIGLIRLALPNARIIHTMRNPIDTCVSCFSRLFTAGQQFSYDLAELGRYYRGYRDLMTHWRNVLAPETILDTVYEDVVDDLEGQARLLIGRCGLPWDQRCVTFYRNGEPVRTASAVQVRKPLFRSSLQRWRNYEAGIGPLLRELGDIVPGQSVVSSTQQRGHEHLRDVA
jgi:tetratricopeptide (TPR) repeat protein